VPTHVCDNGRTGKDTIIYGHLIFKFLVMVAILVQDISCLTQLYKGRQHNYIITNLHTKDSGHHMSTTVISATTLNEGMGDIYNYQYAISACHHTPLKL
jgi:hypothetical protein